MLEVVEGQVDDQVTSVPDERWTTAGYAEGTHSLTVPPAKCLPLSQRHEQQVVVDGLPPGGK